MGRGAGHGEGVVSRAARHGRHKREIEIDSPVDVTPLSPPSPPFNTPDYPLIY